MEEEAEGRIGALTRHSLSSLSKRRPFSRKPSSWRHPGGTVSETEETDLSESESVVEVEARPGVTRHVHSFTFSSLSRLVFGPQLVVKLELFFQVPEQAQLWRKE